MLKFYLNGSHNYSFHFHSDLLHSLIKLLVESFSRGYRGLEDVFQLEEEQ